MDITIIDTRKGTGTISLERLKASAPVHLAIGDRVPGVEGRAFDLKSWYAVWSGAAGTDDANDANDTNDTNDANNTAEADPPTHLRVDGADEFRATIPWSQLDRAALLYEQNGAPLTKGYPLRLYVPDGSSECLNVKSVVTLTFLREAGLGDEAVYGFVNAVSAERLAAGVGRLKGREPKEETV